MSVRPVQPADRPCRHRGGRVRPAGGRAVYRCALHGFCSMGYVRKGIRTCLGCPDRDGGGGTRSGCGGCGTKRPSPAIERRNLIYHVYPAAANHLWRDNVRRLLPRMGAFNGRRVVAVVQDRTTVDAAAVRREFAGRGCRFLVLPNDPELREAATFPHLLRFVADEDPRAATFYAHTKGVSRVAGGYGAWAWRDAMYRHLLDRRRECMEALARYAAVGTTKVVAPGGRPYRFPSGLRHGSWFFAGTFFWFRHDAVFGRPDWNHVPADRYGVEAWPGGLLDPSEAYSIFQPWPEDRWPHPPLYDPRHYVPRRPRPRDVGEAADLVQELLRQ